ncbi:DUF2785 domain-containing protein [Allobranchiibius sp. GilTou73]|uniref:DUF2785 domain-containing protein n=1 Tax=Allobranchiibius sp. GilTou73 TaxID=2904523 RepID=UPI001F2D37EC|nr:DUF2785 domain-containing protein [Allobranchiibius sp. GilTou73]UIJ36125.1 DUF2785 domain-containing protein [Allobranchiibius sp. GilTou73]
MAFTAQLSTLIDDLASPDPVARDERAYPELARMIRAGELTRAEVFDLGRLMIERLAHQTVQARFFASLILARLAEHGTWSDAWTRPLLAWWTGETDLRGYDDRLGWLHAVAHGADCVGQLGSRGLHDPAALLAAVSERLVTATDQVWREQEDDRVAAAVVAILWQSGPTGDTWLGPVRALFDAGEPGPVPAHASNTMRTLRSLYVALDHPVAPTGDVPRRVEGADDLQVRLAALLHSVTPTLWVKR